MAQRSSSRKPRSSGASRRGSGKKSGGAPVWAWLVAGLLAGLFIAFLVYLDGVDTAVEKTAQPQAKQQSEATKEKKGHSDSREKMESKKVAAPKEEVTEQAVVAPPPKAEPTKQESKQPEPKASTETKGAAPAKAQSSGKVEAEKEKPALNYDFYKILPKSEVIVTEEELRKPSSNSATATPGSYYLQVGAFRRIEEADGRKAELAMLGIVSSIQTVTVDPGNSWHRVRIGPVKDMRQLDRTKRQLQENNISFVTLKENR